MDYSNLYDPDYEEPPVDHNNFVNCEEWATMNVGWRVFDNNVWGAHKVPRNEEWSQCLIKENGVPGWTWNYPFCKPTVYGFPSLILGQKVCL